MWGAARIYTVHVRLLDQACCGRATGRGLVLSVDGQAEGTALDVLHAGVANDRRRRHGGDTCGARSKGDEEGPRAFD